MEINGNLSMFLSTVPFIVVVSTLVSVYAQEHITDVNIFKSIAIQPVQIGSIYEISERLYSLGLDDKSDKTKRTVASQSTVDFMGNFPTDFLRFDNKELPGNLRDGVEKDKIFNNNPQFGQNDKKFSIDDDNNIQFDKNNNDDTIISQIENDKNQVIIGGGDDTQIQKDKNQVIIGGGDEIQNINQVDYNKWQTNIDVDYTNKENNNEINQVEVKDNKCPTQSETIQLNDKISAFGVIILAGYEPCKVKDGSVTLNLPSNPNLTFTVIHFDDNSEDQKGAMVDLAKVHDIGSENTLYKVELDDSMTGIEPVTNKKVTIQDINTLALFNNGKETIEFKSDNSVAITSILEK
jgi:hypothetical protein